MRGKSRFISLLSTRTTANIDKPIRTLERTTRNLIRLSVRRFSQPSKTPPTKPKDDSLRPAPSRFTHKIVSKALTEPRFGDLSLAAIFGHAAYWCMGIAYLTKDILALRMLAMGSLTFSMLFQYYRPLPLYLPLRWNAIFWLINLIMATMIVRERIEAEVMSDEWSEIYEQGHFERRGFNKVEFCRLFGLATKAEFKEGEHLLKIGECGDKLFYIASGNASVVRMGFELSKLKQSDFSGEIELIKFLEDHEENLKESTRDVVVGAGGAVVWVWEFSTLKETLEADRETANALLAYVSHELMEKLTDSWDERIISTRQEAKEIQDLINTALS
mmetsp:Transcript_2393/g.3514  ORF Transcript_2393/g.3514 Transcript_2393/m.3514 type:complete len:331 (-) Transcript_2393:1513-2505(-)